MAAVADMKREKIMVKSAANLIYTLGDATLSESGTHHINFWVRMKMGSDLDFPSGDSKAQTAGKFNCCVRNGNR